jgi:hypothetical protein
MYSSASACMLLLTQASKDYPRRNTAPHFCVGRRRNTAPTEFHDFPLADATTWPLGKSLPPHVRANNNHPVNIDNTLVASLLLVVC